MSIQQKRGQVTIIVILAVVLLFIVLFLLFIRASLIKKQITAAAAQEIHDYADQTAIRQYVTSCLDAVSDEVMIRSAMQGGILDFPPDGENKTYTAYFDEIYNRSFNVSIAIIDNYGCPLVRHLPPDYPFENTTLSTLALYYDRMCGTISPLVAYSGFFGLDNYTRLCAWNGSNRVGVTGGRYSYQSCIPGTYNDPDTPSIQDMMEKNISAEMEKCVNVTLIHERFPSNVSMIAAPQTIVTYGETGVTITTAYPFLVTLNNREPVERMINFTVTRDIPYKRMYNYVFRLITADVQLFDFNKFSQQNLAGYNNYIVNRTSIPINNTFVDIIHIIDNGTIIQGRPFMFNVAIWNRRPALDYMHSSNSREWDLVGIENQTLTLRPEGYDPDEDIIFYNYSLWYETYNESYDFTGSKCKNFKNININDLKSCVKRDNPPTIEPHNWTNSTDFKASHQNATILLKKRDIGYHEVNISIWDRGLLKDWQLVRILVIDKPVANATGRNIYDDVKQEMASFEDPYILNGSLSHVIIGGFGLFVWNDTRGDIHATKYSSGPDPFVLSIPNESTYPTVTTFNMKSIVDEPFKRPEQFKSTQTQNPEYSGYIDNITLTVFAAVGGVGISTSDNTTISVNVTQCLPHRNNTDPAFPYNANPADIYSSLQANHTCCLYTYQYDAATTQCYENISYGGNKSFKDLWTPAGVSTAPYPPNGIQNSRRPIITYDYNGDSNTTHSGEAYSLYDNDIYMRTFDRNCSGDRGNICSGNATEVRTLIEKCRDITENPSVFQGRCSGPPLTQYGDAINYDNKNDAHCVNYSGFTFEQLTSNQSNNAPNCVKTRQNVNWQCADISGRFDGSNPKPLACTGACDGQGMCVGDPSTCRCEKACAPNVVDDFCVNQPTYKDIGCLHSTNNVPDLCNGCKYVPGGGKNKNGVIGACSNDNGCRASRECADNNKKPGEALTDGSDGQYCNNTCQLKSCDNGLKYDSSNSNCYSSCVENGTQDNSRCASGSCKSDGSCS